MKISKQARRDAKQLFRKCLVNGALDDSRVRQVVSYVVETRPRGCLGVLSHFHRLVKLALEQRAVRVESAVPLPPALQSELKDKLARMYGPSLDYSFAHNPALLGGLRIQVGSDVYDGSIQARLSALQESL